MIMKFLVPFFLSALIIIALSSTGCKKDLLTGPEAPKIYRFSGKILSEYGNPLGGVKVQINGSVKYSDTNGNFVIYCEANDAVNIQISDSLYLPVKQELSLSSDSSIVFHLLKVIPEHTFLPLAVGNKWSYEFYCYSSDNGRIENTCYNVDWEITAYHPETNTYDIKTQNSAGILIRTVTDRNTNPPAVKKDTTIVNASTGVFQARVEGDLLYFTHQPYDVPLNAFNSRWTPALGDTLELQLPKGSVREEYKFTKDVGISYYYHAAGSMGFFASYSFKLRNYKLKQAAQ
jgi:hypothetical protein